MCVVKNNDQQKMIEAFAGNSWEAALVKSLLNNAGIDCFLKDYIRGTLEPWHVSAGGSNSVKIMILENDIDKARPIIQQYWENLKET